MVEQDNLLTVQRLIEAFQPKIVPAGGFGGLPRVIEGVSVGEEDDPIRWMPPHGLLLTAGTMVRSDPDQGRLLVENLSKAGMVGVGVAMAPYWTDVPDTMIEAADRLSLPLLRISGGIAFHEIVTHIDGALSSRHTYLLQRVNSVQSVLAALMTQDRRPQAIVDCLTDQLGADVLLLDWKGRGICHRSCNGSLMACTDELWQIYSSAPDSASARLTNGREVRFGHVRIEGALEAILAAVLPPGDTADLFVTKTVSFACTLLEVEALIGRSLGPGRVTPEQAS